MIVPSQLVLKLRTNFGCAVSLATLDKLVDRFPLPPVSPLISDTSLTHVCCSWTGRVPAFSKKAQQISLEECGTTFADKAINKIKFTTD
jgi:hypothetical protein